MTIITRTWRRYCLALWTLAILGFGCTVQTGNDPVRALQARAMQTDKASWGHWGARPEQYSHWTNHSNRLVPVYTFGMSLDAVTGSHSVYRDATRLEELYGQTPTETLNPQADYFDQTDIYRLQQQAVAAGKKYVVLMIFDGMDWQTTRAAAVYASGKVGYQSGRGTGLAFQDYRADVAGFGFFVTSPHNTGTVVDVDAQTVVNPGGEVRGGYAANLAGATPWSKPKIDQYLLGSYRKLPHAVADSAAAGTALAAGIKTYNAAINVAPDGTQVEPIARQLQSQKQFAIGVVTNVPISHATPASAYANNVTRKDYQDLTRDLVGQPSVAHRRAPLSGVDVLVGCGWGEDKQSDRKQGRNFVPGNRYLPADLLTAIDVRSGGKYQVAQRTPGRRGKDLLEKAAGQAAREGTRLLGFFGGTEKGNLPYRTADGAFNPAAGVRPAEQYSAADLNENVTLADMTRAALTVLETSTEGFWLMVEAGDIDWANHDNNIDNSIGAVMSGDEAFRAITDWIDARDAWHESAVIVTADHGHYLVLTDPAVLVPKK